MRHDRRHPHQLRPLAFKRRYTRIGPASVLVQMGCTIVLCTCSVDETVPHMTRWEMFQSVVPGVNCIPLSYEGSNVQLPVEDETLSNRAS
jgi:ribonuclease PH